MKKLRVEGLIIHYSEDDTWIEDIELVQHGQKPAIKVNLKTGSFGEPQKSWVIIAEGQVLAHNIATGLFISVWKNQHGRVDISETKVEEAAPLR